MSFQLAVLMVESIVPSLVEPDQPQQVVAPDPSEQARDDTSLPGSGSESYTGFVVSLRMSWRVRPKTLPKVCGR